MAMVAADDPEDVEGLGTGAGVGGNRGSSSRWPGAGAGAGAGAELVGSGPDEADEHPPPPGEGEGQRQGAARRPHVPKLPPVGGWVGGCSTCMALGMSATWLLTHSFSRLP